MPRWNSSSFISHAGRWRRPPGSAKKGWTLPTPACGAITRWSCRWPTRRNHCFSSLGAAIARRRRGRPSDSTRRANRPLHIAARRQPGTTVLAGQTAKAWRASRAATTAPVSAIRYPSGEPVDIREAEPEGEFVCVARAAFLTVAPIGSAAADSGQNLSAPIGRHAIRRAP